MIEIVPVVMDEVRFLGIVMYLPKCTLRMMMNMKLMILDSCFHLEMIEKKCPVPMIQCSSGSFQTMMTQKISACSIKAKESGIENGMNVKEAIECIFSQKETSEERF